MGEVKTYREEGKVKRCEVMKQQNVCIIYESRYRPTVTRFLPSYEDQYRVGRDGVV